MAGSTKTTRENDDEGSDGSPNSTLVVAPSAPGTTPVTGRSVCRVPAVAIWSASGTTCAGEVAVSWSR